MTVHLYIQMCLGVYVACLFAHTREERAEQSKNKRIQSTAMHASSHLAARQRATHLGCLSQFLYIGRLFTFQRRVVDALQAQGPDHGLQGQDSQAEACNAMVKEMTIRSV